MPVASPARSLTSGDLSTITNSQNLNIARFQQIARLPDIYARARVLQSKRVASELALVLLRNFFSLRSQRRSLPARSSRAVNP
jgi:hypothetical protein